MWKRVKPLQAFLTKFQNDWSMTFAGVLAYSLLMAMLPIVVALLAILGFVLGSKSAQGIAQQIISLFPGLAGQQNTLQLAQQQLANSAGLLLIIAVLLAIFGGSSLFVAMEACLNIVYRVRPRTPIRQNLMAAGMFILFIILVPIMIFTSTLPATILSFLQSNPLLQNIPLFSFFARNSFTTYLVGIIGSLIAAYILFEVIYVVVPNQRISFHNSWPGALVAAIAQVLFIQLFPLYQHFAMKNYAGFVGFAVILLIFFYYFAVILMLGAEVNAFFREGIRPLPNDLATFVSTMGGKLNRDIPAEEGHPHVTAETTERADKAHVAEARTQEEQFRQENEQQQQKIVASAAAQGKVKKGKKALATPRMLTVLEVALGSALAFIIELLRLRRRANNQ
ncbi:MAG: YihY/virulence factor BrkB family protein [Ktedonobacteraceae bacterium]|nr:YihY/virulence factor BrkB family protein [Ktedonobacteraceae bacterium]